ncbi:dihydroxyacetone kinase transcriptional activator DhaS [Paenibacillus thiaminolyticus]|uniref:dihydroxyacetone kinase transcriptional activator DhaS n=1 Tax=Paenibacillus thiaminolyticus TaxID=49283 RepID=UPI003D2975C5
MSSSLITKKALATSLKELMNDHPFNKITVKHIVDRCGLNRQTFYYHFQDIYDLLGWVYHSEAVESIAHYRSYSTWTQGLRKIFLYIENNKAFCLNTLNSLARNHLDHYLYSVTLGLMIDVVNEVSDKMEVREEDKKFIANFYALAFTGLVIQWMENGMTENPDRMIQKLNELLEGNFSKALHRYEHKPQ